MVQKARDQAAGSIPPRRGAEKSRGGPNAGKTDAAAATRAEILAAATREFSEKGLSGARVDEIALRTQINKRMIYYYFGSKEGLYSAVLERCYGHIRMSESAMRLDTLPPVEALRQLVRHTFDYHSMHPDFVRLVMNENIHHGAYIAKVTGIQERNTAAIARVADILARGVSARMFRKDIKPVELHMTISALCFYNVSNRYTFSFGFKHDMTSPKAMRARRERVVEIVERWCLL